MYYSETITTVIMNRAEIPIRNVTRQVMSLLYIVVSLFHEIFVGSVSEFAGIFFFFFFFDPLIYLLVVDTDKSFLPLWISVNVNCQLISSNFWQLLPKHLFSWSRLDPSSCSLIGSVEDGSVILVVRCSIGIISSNFCKDNSFQNICSPSQVLLFNWICGIQECLDD